MISGCCCGKKVGGKESILRSGLIQTVFIFIGEMIQFEDYFLRWVAQPPRKNRQDDQFTPAACFIKGSAMYLNL